MFVGKCCQKRRASEHSFCEVQKRRTLTKTPTFIGELEPLDDESVVRPVRLFAEASRHVDFLPVVLQPIDRQFVLGVPDDLAGYLQSLANPCRHVLWTDVDGRGRDHLQAAAGREKIEGEMMVKVLIGLRQFLKKMGRYFGKGKLSLCQSFTTQFCYLHTLDRAKLILGCALVAVGTLIHDLLDDQVAVDHLVVVIVLDQSLVRGPLVLWLWVPPG